MDLSVIIPCHNEAERLPEQLDALAGQRWSGSWEVIVVDNRSSDGTADVAAAHAGLRGRLRVVRAFDGAGVSYARATGVEASAARAVAFCDGDDVVADGWVAAIGDALRDHELVTGEIDVDRINEPAIARSRGARRTGVPPTYGEVTFLRGNNGGMWRSTWDDLGGFDASFHGLEDIELSLRAAARGRRVHFTPHAVVHYRHRSDWRGLWQQGLFYGGSEPMLRRRCAELGLACRPRSAAWRSWAWLIVHAPGAVRATTRPRWVWTLACRMGALRQSLRSLREGKALSRRDLVGPEQGAQTPSTVSARSYSAIVVTFRRPDSLREVLRGLSEQDLPPTLVVVADNDPNGSAAPVVAQLSAPFEVAYLAVGRNLGPAGGWARGVDHASRRADRGSWVAVFDDDDPISHPQVMGRLAAFAATAPADVAAIGRRGAHLRRWSATLRRVTPSASGRPADADYLASGGAPLYRWTAVDAVGFFDPELFFGFEDLELGIRLRRAGMRLLVLDLDDLEVVADTAPTRAAWREYYKVRSLTVICRRHLGGVALACTLVRALLLGTPRLVLAAHGLDLVRARWRGARDGLSGRLGPGASAPESNPPKRGAAV